MKNIIKNLIFVFIFFGILGVGAEISLSASSPSIISGTASSITTNSATLNGIVNPNGDDTTAWFETTSGGPFQLQNIGNGTTDVSLLSYNLTGLTSSTTYNFKIIAGNASGSTDSGFIFSFTTNADPVPPVLPSPTIVSGTATSVTSNSATLNGIVNPNGYSTTVWFETASSGPLQVQNIGNGTTDVSLLSYNLTSLSPSTTYTFKIKAGNANGPVDGGWISFTTNAPPVGPILPAPTIISNTTTNITSTGVTLNGLVNPNGYTTTSWFETPSGGPFQVQNIGNGNSNVVMLAYNLTGLTPSTTYTFKIKAGNANGSVDSGWVSFTTNAGAIPPVLLAPTIVSQSASSVTTNSAILNSIVNPNGYATTAWFETPSAGPLQLQNIGNGNSNVTITSYSLTGLTPSTTYTFKIKAGNANGSVDSGWISFTTASSGGGGGGCSTPTITSLSPSSVAEGTGAVLVTITGSNFLSGVSSALFNGITRTTNFINGTSLTINLIASDVSLAGSGNITVANGTCVSGSSTFTINSNTPSGGGGGGGGTSYVNPTLITQNATKINTKEATLNGSMNPNGYSANVWFEYGTSSTLATPSETAHTMISSGNSVLPITQNISNITPDTTYYFRIVANNPSGITKGSILSFKTLSVTETKITPTITTTTKTNETVTAKIVKKPIPNKIVNKENLINDPSLDYSEIKTAEIEISTMKEDVAIKDEISYSITFKNLIEKNLENIKIVVYLPKEIDFKESNIGIIGDENTVILNSEILFPNETNTLIIKGVVNSNASLQKIITTKVSATYNVAGSSLKKEEISSVTNYVVSNILLQASSILSLSYMPYWIGLMALIFIIIGLVIFGKKLYKSKF